MPHRAPSRKSSARSRRVLVTVAQSLCSDLVLPSQNHTLAMVSPHLKEQLRKTTKAVPLRFWLSVMFGDIFDKFQVLERQIDTQNWFLDDEVQARLREFCEAEEEEDRYVPFVNLANYLLERARKSLPDVSYPISDVSFSNNATTDVDHVPSSSQNDKAPAERPKRSSKVVAARRRPDIIVARKLSEEELARRLAGSVKHEEEDAASTDDSGCKRRWDEILQWWELKKVLDPSRLRAELDKEKARAAANARAATKVCTPVSYP